MHIHKMLAGLTYVLSAVQTVIGFIYLGVYTFIGPPKHGLIDNSGPMAMETAVALTAGGFCMFVLCAQRFRNDSDVANLLIVNRNLSETLAATLAVKTAEAASVLGDGNAGSRSGILKQSAAGVVAAMMAVPIH